MSDAVLHGAPTASRPAAPPRLRLYPERPAEPDGWLDRTARRLGGHLAAGWQRVAGHGLTRILRETAPHEAELARLDDPALDREIAALRRRLHREGLDSPAVGRTFALVRELAARTLGQRPYDVQLLGGYALLKGLVAEMQTGEGKTLTATLPVAVAGLAGVPVHVITANDYLAARDAALLAPLYARLGLSVGTIVEATPHGERRACYARDVVYATNKQIAFDYLRDRMTLAGFGGELRLKLERLHAPQPVADRLLMRGLHFAIVDEADSVMIDEARTPLVISGLGGEALEAATAVQALELACELVEWRDFRIDPAAGAMLTEAGQEQVARMAGHLGGLWLGERRRREFVEQALSALHLYRRDEHYLVRDGKVVIVDEFTGRTMADRFWGQGLHQMIEAKEGVATTGARHTLAQITYQRFFRRYLRLGGMTGTAAEVAGELRAVYRLPVARIPTHRPVRRRHRGTRVFRDADAKWRAVAQRAAELRAAGRPVLIGTRTVASSKSASAALTASAVPHTVLSADQDAHEAEVVAAAGKPATVTVATNMAGRGTDIALAPEAVAAGGLHIIVSELNDAGRIDRQLAGRAARQGDPGSVEYCLSANDPVTEGAGAGDPLVAALLRTGALQRLPRAVAFRVLRRAQRHLELVHARTRRAQLRADRLRSKAMAFTGRAE